MGKDGAAATEGKEGISLQVSKHKLCKRLIKRKRHPTHRFKNGTEDMSTLHLGKCQFSYPSWHHITFYISFEKIITGPLRNKEDT